MNKTDLRVQETIAWLNSDAGKKNWKLNEADGFSPYQNLYSNVLIATGLVKRKKIIEVIKAFRKINNIKTMDDITAYVIGCSSGSKPENICLGG